MPAILLLPAVASVRRRLRAGLGVDPARRRERRPHVVAHRADGRSRRFRDRACRSSSRSARSCGTRPRPARRGTSPTSSRRSSCCWRSGPASSTPGPASIGLFFAAAVLARARRSPWPHRSSSPTWPIERSARRPDDPTVFGSTGRRPTVVLADPGRPPRVRRPRLAAGAARPVPARGYLIYDWLRFGSVTQNGYALIPGLLQEDQYRNGFFSIFNIPRKLYALFLTMPVQVERVPLGPVATARRPEHRAHLADSSSGRSRRADPTGSGSGPG